jgi:hypothetical protein
MHGEESELGGLGLDLVPEFAEQPRDGERAEDEEQDRASPALHPGDEDGGREERRDAGDEVDKEGPGDS